MTWLLWFIQRKAHSSCDKCVLNIDQTTRKLLVSWESIYHVLLVSNTMKINNPTLTRNTFSNLAMIINNEYSKLLVPNQVFIKNQNLIHLLGAKKLMRWGLLLTSLNHAAWGQITSFSSSIWSTSRLMTEKYPATKHWS